MVFIETNQSKSTTNKCCMKLKTVCPPQGSFAFTITNVLLSVLTFGFCWGVTGEMCLPGGKFYALIVIFYTSYSFGVLATKICLPDLFGNSIHCNSILVNLMGQFRAVDILFRNDNFWYCFKKYSTFKT